MELEETHLYHVFNRGNNKDIIFYQKRNYYYFLEKMIRHIKPKCELLAYCLMPNHFHFLIYASPLSVQKVKIGSVEMSYFSKGIKDLLSTYSKGVAKQEGRVDSLFAKGTKAVPLQDWNNNYDYSTVCFNYIHRNPLKSNLVPKLNEWAYSSFHEYTGRYRKNICNQALAKEMIDLDWDNFYESTLLSEDDQRKIEKII